MKRRISQILGVLVAILILDRLSFAVLERCHRTVIYDAPQGQIAWYMRRQKRHEVLIFGASKSKHGLIPSRLGSEWFNLAQGGMHEAYSLCALSLIVDAGLPPKAVVLGVSPKFFYLSPGVEDGADETAQYFRYYYPQSRTVRECIREISPFEPMKFAFSSYRFNPDVLNLLVGYLKHLGGRRGSSFDRLSFTNGFVPLGQVGNPETGPSWLNDVELQFEEEVLHSRSERFSEQRFGYLVRFVEYCEKRDIQIALVALPQLLGQDPHFYTEGWRRVVSLAEEHEGVVFIDFASNAEALELDWSCWSDRYHLSEQGAEKVTDALREALLKRSRWREFLSPEE